MKKHHQAIIQLKTKNFKQILKKNIRNMFKTIKIIMKTQSYPNNKLHLIIMKLTIK